MNALPTVSESDVGGMAAEVEPSHQYSITCCCHTTDSSRRAADNMATNVEVCMKQSCGTEFLHAEKIALIDIHPPLLNTDGDQTARK